MNILSSSIQNQGLTNYNPAGVATNTITANKSVQNLKAPNSTTKTSLFYINDIHGQVPKMQRLVSAALDANVSAAQNGADFLKLSSGDTFIGSDDKRNTVAAHFLDTAGLHAQTLGNHEFDITASICGNLLKNSKTNILAMNLNFPDQSAPLAQKILRSTIVEGESGEKYGLIGVQPSDLGQRIKNQSILEGITVDDKEQTIKELQEEVNLLKQQGLNKIILLSHEGNTVEKEIAQAVSGIDVILGGHSHDLIEGVKPGENLFYSPAGEPVVVTQAGRDGNNFGILNLEFNDAGQITYVQNNVMDTNMYKPNLMMTKTADSILGVSPEIGTLGYVDPLPKNNLTEENPWADFVSDAIRKNLDVDIALVNSGNFRGSVDIGNITERDIESIFPFSNKLYKVQLNEKDLVDALNFCGKSLTAKNSKPGLMQVSGLTYTLDAQGNLTELNLVDKNGQKQAIDVNNPNPNKIYTAAYDEFLVNGGDKLEMLKRNDNQILERYTFDKDKPTIDYIKSLSGPFEVRKDNRITILK